MKSYYFFIKSFIIASLCTSSIFAQLKLSVFTDKDHYEYGENIQIFCKVTNPADTTFEFRAGTHGTCQAEFSFNDFNSWEHTACLTLTELLTFKPHASKIYSWNIIPNETGLPNKNGTQAIIGKYYFDLDDTVYINAPQFLGGRISANFSKANSTSVQNIKDSLMVTVLETFEFDGKVSEIWQIEGFQIDSIIVQLQNNSIFNHVEKAIWIEYDKIVDVNPLDYYPLHVGDKRIYDVKYIIGWDGGELNYSLSREVMKDTTLSNNKTYFQIYELRSDTNLVKINYERIDSLNGKIYKYNKFTEKEFVLFDLIAPINLPFLSVNEYFDQYGEQLIYLSETGEENIFYQQLKKVGYRLYTTTYNSYGFSYKLNESIGTTYFLNFIIDGFDEHHNLKAAYINGVKYGDTTLVGVNENNLETIPTQYSLSQNYPNPFNPTTTIEYTIPSLKKENFPSLQNVQLKIYDVLGKEITTLVNEAKKPGTYQAIIDASNLASGIYYYQLKTNGFIETKKMIVLK